MSYILKLAHQTKIYRVDMTWINPIEKSTHGYKEFIFLNHAIKVIIYPRIGLHQSIKKYTYISVIRHCTIFIIFVIKKKKNINHKSFILNLSQHLSQTKRRQRSLLFKNVKNKLRDTRQPLLEYFLEASLLKYKKNIY